MMVNIKVGIPHHYQGCVARNSEERDKSCSSSSIESSALDVKGIKTKSKERVSKDWLGVMGIEGTVRRRAEL
jgi:hypothetical protein